MKHTSVTTLQYCTDSHCYSSPPLPSLSLRVCFLYIPLPPCTSFWQGMVSSHIVWYSFAFGYCCVLMLFGILSQVALHLLTEKEKNDLAQLVSTMVSYSITYKNIKSTPLSCNQEHEAALDALGLSFDPPICDFISFKV